MKILNNMSENLPKTEKEFSRTEQIGTIQNKQTFNLKMLLHNKVPYHSRVDECSLLSVLTCHPAPFVKSSLSGTSSKTFGHSLTELKKNHVLMKAQYYSPKPFPFFHTFT